MFWKRKKKPQIKTIIMENIKELEKIAELEKQLAELKQIVQDKQKESSAYQSVLTKLGHDESKDVVKIDGFSNGQMELVLAIIKKIRICSAINEGWLPSREDRRYYPYYDVSSGFDFYPASCDGTAANAGSASRLCFKDAKRASEYHKLFGESVERKIIGF